MRCALLLLGFILSVVSTSEAFAANIETKAFPPEKCAPDASNPTEMRVVAWQDGINSKCLRAEEAVAIAFEQLKCEEGQTISIKNKGTELYCK